MGLILHGSYYHLAKRLLGIEYVKRVEEDEDESGGAEKKHRTSVLAAGWNTWGEDRSLVGLSYLSCVNCCDLCGELLTISLIFLITILSDTF